VGEEERICGGDGRFAEHDRGKQEASRGTLELMEYDVDPATTHCKVRGASASAGLWLSASCSCQHHEHENEKAQHRKTQNPQLPTVVVVSRLVSIWRVLSL
jgi:hypothetical protein